MRERGREKGEEREGERGEKDREERRERREGERGEERMYVYGVLSLVWTCARMYVRRAKGCPRGSSLSPSPCLVFGTMLLTDSGVHGRGTVWPVTPPVCAELV